WKTMEPNELRAALEAILFISTEPVNLDDLVAAFSDDGRDAVVAQLDEIKKNFDEHVGGFVLEQTAGGWRFATRAQHDSILKKYFAKKGENRLSLAALETLAIIGYRQPMTAPEISDIRGVNSTSSIRTLLERRMIRVAGRKNVVGSPFLYRTTKDRQKSKRILRFARNTGRIESFAANESDATRATAENHRPRRICIAA